jgi:hypothetical protein
LILQTCQAAGAEHSSFGSLEQESLGQHSLTWVTG